MARYEGEKGHMSEEIRFALTTSLEPIQNFVLTANFDEVKAQLRELMQPYEKLVISEDDMAEAKNILARIRKVKTGIDEYRKSIKKEYSAPLAAFEERVKDVISVCTESESNLSEQINKFDRKRREEKFAALEQFFNDNVGSMAEFLTFDQIRNDRWGNATFSMDDAQAEIAKAMDMCEDGVNAIRSLGSPFEASLLNAYRKNHDLAGAMKLNGELTEQKRRDDERKAAIEAAKTVPQRKEVEEVQRIAKPEPKPEPPIVDADKLYTVTLKIHGTQEQLVALRKYLDDAGMTFQSVK